MNPQPTKPQLDRPTDSGSGRAWVEPRAQMLTAIDRALAWADHTLAPVVALAQHRHILTQAGDGWWPPSIVDGLTSAATALTTRGSHVEDLADELTAAASAARAVTRAPHAFTTTTASIAALVEAGEIDAATAHRVLRALSTELIASGRVTQAWADHAITTATTHPKERR